MIDDGVKSYKEGKVMLRLGLIRLVVFLEWGTAGHGEGGTSVSERLMDDIAFTYIPRSYDANHNSESLIWCSLPLVIVM